MHGILILLCSPGVPEVVSTIPEFCKWWNWQLKMSELGEAPKKAKCSCNGSQNGSTMAWGKARKAPCMSTVMHVAYSGFSVCRGGVHDVNDIQVMCVHYKHFCGFVLWPRSAAMVRPVRPWPYLFLREKNGITQILNYACVMHGMASPSDSSWLRTSELWRSLPRSFFESSSIQFSDERLRLLNFLWSAQIGEGLTCAKCSVILGFNDFKRLH